MHNASAFSQHCLNLFWRLGLFAMLCLAILLPTTASHAEHLMDVYLSAKENDAVLRGAEASFRADREQIKQARSTLLPSVGASARTNYNELTFPGAIDEASGQPIPELAYNDHSWSAQLRQPILNLPSWFNVASAKSAVSASSLQLEAQRQNLLVRVLDAYLNVLRTRDRLDTTTAEVEAVQRQLEQIQQRFEVGLVAITDVLEAQAAYDSAVVRRIQAETNHDISYETLSTLTGRSYDQLARLSPELPIVSPEPTDEEAWVDKSMSSNLAIRAAAEQLNAARRDSRSRLAGHLPTIDATVTQTNSVSGGPSFFPTEDTESTIYALEVSVPIYQGGRTRSRVREGQARVEQARQQLLNQQRTVIRDTRNLFKAVKTDVARVKARLKAIRSTQSALEATQTGYEVGTRNIVDVLQAQQRLYSSQFDYADSRYNYLLNLIRLRQVTGKLGQKDLEALNAFFAGQTPVTRNVSLAAS